MPWRHCRARAAGAFGKDFVGTVMTSSARYWPPYRREISFSPFVRLLGSGIVAICLLAIVGGGGAAAEAPPIQDFLEAWGYSAASYEIQMAWVEMAHNGSGEQVNGVRLRPKEGASAFDVYFDASGALLDDLALEALGISRKNWEPQDGARDAEPHGAFEKRAKDMVVPCAPPPVEEIVFPPIDETRLLLEDDEAKGAERIGIHRVFDLPVSVHGGVASDGQWVKSKDGGRLWNIALRSMGALGIRVHFSAIMLPPGARLILYNADDPMEAYGPFETGEDFWTPTCFGESVVLECHVNAMSALEDVILSIDRITHNYKAVDDFLKAGTCNLDVACYSAWQTASWGIGGIGSISKEGVLWCTGSLVADGNPGTTVPYFLTAYHCVSSSYEANTIEVYWLYQRQSCGGNLPGILTVPRTTGGASFLAGASNTYGSDFAFLRLRNAPTAAITYLGYETAAAAVGTNTACIHHPSGDYKRISFGAITNDGSPQEGGARLKPIERFHEVLWSNGTTEGGSSGSPLFNQGTQRIIGQLYGGHASCLARNEPDYFGRFDVTYPLIAEWLENNPYDVNGNGTVDDADLTLVISAVLRRANVANADVNGSGAIDAVDLQLEAMAVAAGKQ